MVEVGVRAVAVFSLAALVSAPHGFGAALLGLGRRHSPLTRRLLLVMLVERAGLRAELEERHLALGAFTQAQRNHRGPYPGAHINRALRVLCPAGAVEPMNVLVTSELPDRKLVQPSDRDLAGVGVTGKHERDPSLPKRVSFLCDVRKCDDRQVVKNYQGGI